MQQQTILEEKCSYQQVLKERDELFVQLQKQNLSLRSALSKSEQARLHGYRLLQLCVGLLILVKATIPAEVAEYLGGQK